MAFNLPNTLGRLKIFGVKESTGVILEILDCAEEVINYVSSDSREHSLVVAALDGDVHRVSDLLAQGCDVNAYADPGCGGAATALWWAAVHGRLNVMKLLLLQENIKINEQCGDFGFTPLMAACAYGQVDTAKLLIYKGCHVLVQEGWRTALSLVLHSKWGQLPSTAQRRELLLVLLQHYPMGPVRKVAIKQVETHHPGLLSRADVQYLVHGPTLQELCKNVILQHVAQSDLSSLSLPISIISYLAAPI